MLRLIAPLFMIAGVNAYSGVADAASFPPVIDTRTSPLGAVDVYEPREINVIAADDSFVDVVEIDDIDNDGIKDHQFTVYTAAFIEEYGASDSPSELSCPSSYIAASSLVGSTVAITDAIEIKGLELLYQSSEHTYFDCFFGFGLAPQVIPDLNNDQINELSFDSYIGLDGGESEIASVVAFGTLEVGAVIDMAAVIAGDGGFTVPDYVYLQYMQADINGDGISDPVIYDYRGVYGGDDADARFGVINGASLASVVNVSFDSLGTENLLVDMQSSIVYIELADAADFNNDSFDDLLLTVYGENTGNTNYVLYGAADISVSLQSANVDAVLTPFNVCNNCSVQMAGDFNADGFADVVLSDYQPTGAVEAKHVILYGSNEGLPSAIESANSTMIDFGETDGFDYVFLAAKGDLNNDGASDLYFGRYDGLEVVLLGQAVANPGDIDVDQLNGENGFLIIGSEEADYYSAQFVDINGDGYDDLVGEYSNTILLLGRQDTNQPLAVQGLSVATGQSDTFLSWTTPEVGSDVGRIELSVNGTLIDIVDADTGYYQFSQPAPDSTAVLRVQAVTYQQEKSPARDVPLSNPYQALRQLRANVYGSNAVELFWDNEPSDYVVWRNGEVLAQIQANSYYDSTVLPGVEYRYHVVQGRDASGLTLGRSTSLPVEDSYYGCIDYCDDSYLYEYTDYIYNQCLTNGVVDNRVSAQRSLYPASTDELLVVTDTVGVEFATPTVEVINNCEQPTEFRTQYSYYQQYSQTALEIFWGRANHPSGVVAYEVSLFGEVIATLDATSYFVDNVGGEALYEYKVTAIAGDGSRSIPAIYSVYLPENDIGYVDESLEPPAPTIVRAEVYSSTAAELFWDGVYDYFGNPVQYKVSRNGELLQTIDAKSYFDSTLQPGNTYTYEVVTVSQAGIYGEASTIEIITPSVAGAIENGGDDVVPAGARGQVYSNNSVELFWDRPSDSSVSYYVVSRNDSQLGETGGTSYYSSGLDADTDYRYSIQAKDNSGANVGSAARVLLRTTR